MQRIYHGKKKHSKTVSLNGDENDNGGDDNHVHDDDNDNLNLNSSVWRDDPIVRADQNTDDGDHDNDHDGYNDDNGYWMGWL